MKKFSIIFSFILLFFVAVSTSSYAADYQDPLELETNYEYKQYFIYDNTLILVSSDKPLGSTYPLIKTNYGTSKKDVLYYVLQGPASFQILKYQLNSSNKWSGRTEIENLTINDGDYLNNCRHYYHSYMTPTRLSDWKASTVNVMMEDQETMETAVFFRKTPAQELTLAEMTQALIAEEVPEAQSQVLGTMNILLLCGVGCLAFLMALALFGKVFRRFQVR